MRTLKVICLSALLLYALGVEVVHSGQRAIRVSARTPEGKEIPLYRGSFALVVGNDAYRGGGWDPLPGTIRDVHEVAEALERNGFQVILRTNLTKNAFSREMEAFCHKYGADPDNRLLFYFAGHGHTRKMATGEDLGYLVMVESPSPESDPVGFGLASVDMQSIVTRAKMIQARHVLFMFDSCFSGSILNLRERVTPQHISENMRLPVRQFITAGSANEPVPDHSIFKQAFLDLLEGRDREPIPDGYITGEELGLYLKHKVPKYNPAQHPQYGKINDIHLDKGDFIFALKPSTRTQPPQQPSGIADYDSVILERETARREWTQWQTHMETDFNKADRYDRSDELTADEKEAAWRSFLAAYALDNPYSRRDEEMRALAEERRVRWTSDPVLSPTPVPLDSRPSAPIGSLTRNGFFIADAKGIVQDTRTGLEWVAGPDRDMTWDEAQSWVENLNREGGGWRMPTIQELKGLYNEHLGTRNMTPLLETTGWSVWSGEVRDPASRWAFLFNFGSVIWYGRNYAYEGRAFAVRYGRRK